MNHQRRHFLKFAATVLVTASAPFSSRLLADKPATVFFREGVASADPGPDSVILWTRAEPRNPAAAGGTQELLLQVSESENFRQVVAEETVVARAGDDFTVRARVHDLKAGQHYFYRFLAAAGGRSRVGRTMTAPAADDPRTVHMAFASCQNYEQGYYGAWGRMVEDDRGKPPGEQIQFVLHLGDFIYERYWHRAAEGMTFARPLPPFPDGARANGREWAQSLADYRHLYKTYLQDPMLQAARARWPFICTWDDHEFTNNSFGNFSTYGSEPRAEPQRQLDAHRAWFEYIPAQVERTEGALTIYRRLRWGRQLDLVMTDLRSYRSAPTLPKGLSHELGLPMDPVELVAICDGGRDYDNGNPPEWLPFGDGTHPNPARNRDPGTLLGVEQKRWFKQQLKSSTASWKIWGNSLPLLPLRLDLSAIPLAGMHNGILSADAWAGFPGEYRELMDFVADKGITGLVSLSGDHHMQGASTLARNPDDPASPAVAADFNVTGISSSNLFRGVLHRAMRGQSDFMQLVAGEADGRTREIWNMTLTHGVLASMAFNQTGWRGLSDWLGPNSANPGLAYVDSNSNGYGLGSFGAQGCDVQLVTVSDPSQASSSAAADVRHTATFHLPLWSGEDRPDLQGPTITGEPPFPHA